jgi:hypothetical protein
MDAVKLVATDFDKFMNVSKGKIQRNRMIAILSSAFTQAVRWTLLPHNICMFVDRHEKGRRDRYVTTDELQRIKAFFPPGGRTVYLAMDVAAATGMTQSEILDLLWSDVNRPARTITYHQKKLRRKVTIPITSTIRAILDQCWQLPNRGRHVIGRRRGDSGRYTGEGFRAIWQRTVRKWVRAGNTRFTFQDIHRKWERDKQTTRIPAEIQELVNRATESPGVEFKQWMSLSDQRVRANIARHLAALANHGGGYLILGFLKDGTLDPAHPEDLSAFNHDEVAGIVDKYLAPAFHCDVSLARPDGSGQDCVVIHVPTHGSVPICAKADGPHNEKGKPQGILIGRYYTRVNGPKSEPIETPERWTPVIRRCVVNERQLLLDNIAALLPRVEPVPPTLSEVAPKRAVARRTHKPNARDRVRMGAPRLWKRRKADHEK